MTGSELQTLVQPHCGLLGLAFSRSFFFNLGRPCQTFCFWVLFFLNVIIIQKSQSFQEGKGIYPSQASNLCRKHSGNKVQTSLYCLIKEERISTIKMMWEGKKFRSWAVGLGPKLDLTVKVFLLS